MKTYNKPVLSDYGSIADCTFATPGSNYPVVEQDPPGPFSCTGAGLGSGDPGTKNTLVLQCDKFGEYSHS
jgi:hypothetical protein